MAFKPKVEAGRSITVILVRFLNDFRVPSLEGRMLQQLWLGLCGVPLGKVISLALVDGSSTPSHPKHELIQLGHP